MKENIFKRLGKLEHWAKMNRAEFDTKAKNERPQYRMDKPLFHNK